MENSRSTDEQLIGLLKRVEDRVPVKDLSRTHGYSDAMYYRLQRIKPGQPQQNGRHERMHLTLKNETTKSAAFNFLQQQERFEDFIPVYNQERPYQAIGGAYPAEIYTPSARRYEPSQDPDYPI